MKFEDLMKQAQGLQEKMRVAQEKMESVIVEGESGGGAVRVRLNGKGEMVGIEISDSYLHVDEKEICEDLIIAAHRDARSRLDHALSSRMDEIAPGMSSLSSLMKGF